MEKLKDRLNSVEAITESLVTVRKEIESLKALEDNIKANLVQAFEVQLVAAYKEKPEPFGVVNFKDGEFKISFTTPKKVKYDQKGLAELYKQGAPVDVEYSIKEAVYKDLDQSGKEAIMPFRTVEPGSIAIKIERV